MKLAGRFQFGAEFVLPIIDRFEDRFCISGEEDDIYNLSNGHIEEGTKHQVNIYTK